MKDNTQLEAEGITILKASEFRGRPIREDMVAPSDRLMEIDNVLKGAFCDNPKTLIAQFSLHLPEDAKVQRRSTIRTDRIYRRFIKYLSLEIESEIVEEGRYIPNSLRYLMRKEYVNKGTPYFSYEMAVLVNGEIYEDVDVCSHSKKSLIEKVIIAWVEATKLDFPAIYKVLPKTFKPILFIDNSLEERMSDYDNVHYHLSSFARLKGRVSCQKGTFDYSEI